MKYQSIEKCYHLNYVAPLVGAWIEIMLLFNVSNHVKVAPLVGAWIEIYRCYKLRYFSEVAPLVGAWIEISVDQLFTVIPTVAPLVGAWIEIIGKLQPHIISACRSSCRSVD